MAMKVTGVAAVSAGYGTPSTVVATYVWAKAAEPEVSATARIHPARDNNALPFFRPAEKRLYSAVMPFGVFLLAALAAAPKPWAQGVLEEQCLMHAADPKNPWALAHGITGLGKKFAAADGRLASQVMVNDFLLKAPPAPDGGVPAGNAYAFLKYGPDRTPIEPHPNLITKTLLLAGLPPSTPFETRVGKVTLQTLIDSARLGFRHVPQSEDYWKEVAWTLDLLGAGLKPGKPARFTVSDGTLVDFDAVMDDALARHQQATLGLEEGMKKGLPLVGKNKQGVYSHSCGGLHLTQAIIAWARHPAAKKRWGAKFESLIAVLFYRLESERAQYDAALQQAPQYRLQVLTQMVKFYGHFLETTARLKQTGWKPTEPQAQAVRKAKALLDAATRWLEEDKAFTRMDQLKKTHHQVWLDLIGDSCHAAHGLQGWP
jgi:hypothetical protein